MHAILKKFGNRVRALRLRAGMSQEELAERCSLHRTYVGGIERGERNIGLINVYALADALGEPVAGLFADGPLGPEVRGKPVPRRRGGRPRG